MKFALYTFMLQDAGQWLVAKARRQATESGVQTAARNLRKQGVPLELALRILFAPRPVCAR